MSWSLSDKCTNQPPSSIWLVEELTVCAAVYESCLVLRIQRRQIIRTTTLDSYEGLVVVNVDRTQDSALLGWGSLRKSIQRGKDCLDQRKQAQARNGEGMHGSEGLNA